MTRMLLQLHPDARCEAVTRIAVEAARPRADTLTLRYLVTGAIADLRIPAATAPARADGLWRHTCFEAFVRAAPERAYHEYNFAPSTQWAAYRFDDYRSGMADAELDPPVIATRTGNDCYELQTAIKLDRPRADTAWRLGLSAVIEEANGRKSYWALAHPPGKADFHHPNGFVHELPGF